MLKKNQKDNPILNSLKNWNELDQENKIFYNKNYKKEKVMTLKDKEIYTYGLVEIILQRWLYYKN